MTPLLQLPLPFPITDPRLTYAVREDAEVHMSDVRCTGNEDSLLDCPHVGAEAHGCRRAVSINCSGIIISRKECKYSLTFYLKCHR